MINGKRSTNYANKIKIITRIFIEYLKRTAGFLKKREKISNQFMHLGVSHWMTCRIVLCMKVKTGLKYGSII